MKVLTASVREWGMDETTISFWCLMGEEVLVVVDMADVPVTVPKEDGSGSEVVRGRIQAHNEAAGEQVLTAHLVVRVRVDEDVGEGSGCVADIAAPLKNVEQLTNLTVDP